MEIIEIIKDAFVFPSKNIQQLLIYVVLSILAGAFSVIGTLVYILGFINAQCFLFGGLIFIASLLIGWVLLGYLISVIKSGIDLDDEVPVFEWWENFITGFNNFIVSIVYYIIPAFIVVVVGYATNAQGIFKVLSQDILILVHNAYKGSANAFLLSPIAQDMISLVAYLALLITFALVLFVIFSFIQTMAEARLANTGSLCEALNVWEAAKDIKRIGIGKVIIVILLVIIIIAVIEGILSTIFNYVPILSILSIIISPYLLFFSQRAVGLLYSDIA